MEEEMWLSCIGLSFFIAIVAILALSTGQVFLRDHASNVLGEIKNLTDLMEKSGESSCVAYDTIAAQVRGLSIVVQDLALEVRQLSSQQTSLQNENPDQIVQGDLSALVLPAAVALCALAYGIMWWKGLSFSNLVLATKRNAANAVTKLVKHLENVIVATKRELIHRIENLNEKVDDQVEISRSIRTEVNDVRGGLSAINANLDELQRTVKLLDCNGSVYIH